jgi:NADH:ubiquinone reductase (H+-translocating)
MAGAICELAHHTLRHDFRTLDPATARIVLVENGPRVLQPFPESLSIKARKALENMGIEVWLQSTVKDISADRVRIDRNGELVDLQSRTVVWAAGVKASPLGKMLADATGATCDRAGRVAVQPDLTLPGHKNIYICGDMVSLVSNGKPVPGVAPAAIQMGKFAASCVKLRSANRDDVGTFVYWDKGSMATIGRNAAVLHSGVLKLSGFIAWLGWLFIHILYLVNFSNRFMVMFQWFWNYITRNRSARLITGEKR